MHIFDGFPSRRHAERFASFLERTTGRTATVADEQRDDLDPFPYELQPPIVYLERAELDGLDGDQALDDAVDSFGGKYVGT